MFVDLLAAYGRLLMVSTPLFIAIFFFTWWMRGRGFGEFAALLRRFDFRPGRDRGRGRDKD